MLVTKFSGTASNISNNCILRILPLVVLISCLIDATWLTVYGIVEYIDPIVIS